MASTGLNEPCFCGSGKRYEDCCFLKDIEEVQEKGPSSTGSRLKEAIERKSFKTLQEAQEFLDRVVSDHCCLLYLSSRCGAVGKNFHQLLKVIDLFEMQKSLAGPFYLICR